MALTLVSFGLYEVSSNIFNIPVKENIERQNHPILAELERKINKKLILEVLK